jgi:hypothetical protein
VASLSVNLREEFGSASQATSKPKLRVVSREPFSPVASFFLGLSAGLVAASGLFAILFR